MQILGRSSNFEYSEHWIGYAVLVLRVVMGRTLFQGEVTKLVTSVDAESQARCRFFVDPSLRRGFGATFGNRG
ncbi:MAG: hypothetical protein ABEI27_07225 [Halobellus sp.]|uniref:hypothetical protein n=1 Tax=Halobellus sp. TaxID=1979212 RepID=UPI0035D5014B